MASPPRYRIITYETMEPENTPASAMFGAAAFLGYEPHPRWTCSGPTAEAAREKMEEFWAKEMKHHASPERPKRGAPAPGVDAPEEPAPVVADDDEVL